MFGSFSDQKMYQYGVLLNSNKIVDKTNASLDFQTTFSSTVPQFVKSAEFENSTSEIVTEISTSISLIGTDIVVLKEMKPANDIEPSSTFLAEEQRNTFANLDSDNFTDSTSAYDKIDKTNFTAKDLGATMKTLPLEIEMLLNLTKKKPDDEFELDYDEPTLPPSLPNLKYVWTDVPEWWGSEKLNIGQITLEIMKKSRSILMRIKMSRTIWGKVLQFEINLRINL